MRLGDDDLQNYDDRALKLKPATRDAYLGQVNNLIDGFTKKVGEDGSFRIIKFLRAGSLPKGTVLRQRVDADIAVFLDFDESERFDMAPLFAEIVRLLVSIYPQKKPEDFTTQAHTLGITFRTSGLLVDLVPVIATGDEGFAWQPASAGGPPVLTNIAAQLAFVREHKSRDRRYRRLVRLLKAWRNFHVLEISSFAIELLVAHLQDELGNATSGEDGLLRFFEWVSSTALLSPVTFGAEAEFDDSVVVVDPVNSANNVTGRMTDAERRDIVAAANDAWESLTTAQWNHYSGETLELWKDVFGRSFTIEPVEEAA